MVPKAFLGLAGIGVLSLVGMVLSGKNKMSNTEQNDLQMQRGDLNLSVNLDNDDEKKNGLKVAVQDVGSDKSSNDKGAEKENIELKSDEEKSEEDLAQQSPNQISEVPISKNETKTKKPKFQKPDFSYDAMQDFVVMTEDEAADGKTD